MTAGKVDGTGSAGKDLKKLAGNAVGMSGTALKVLKRLAGNAVGSTTIGSAGNERKELAGRAVGGGIPFPSNEPSVTVTKTRVGAAQASISAARFRRRANTGSERRRKTTNAVGKEFHILN